jgi:hypothetical protein
MSSITTVIMIRRMAREVRPNVALERLAHSTNKRSPFPAGPLQALVMPPVMRYRSVQFFPALPLIRWRTSANSNPFSRKILSATDALLPQLFDCCLNKPSNKCSVPTSLCFRFSDSSCAYSNTRLDIRLKGISTDVGIFSPLVRDASTREHWCEPDGIALRLTSCLVDQPQPNKPTLSL